MLSILNLFEKQEFKPGKKTKTGEYTHYEVKKKPSKGDAVVDSDSGGPMVRSKSFTSKDGKKVVLRFQINKSAGPEGGHSKLVSKLEK
jgi:hypothetical protein